MTSNIKFIKQIRVARLVNDDSLTDEEILKAFQAKLTSKQLRTVLANGIHELYNTSENVTKVLDPLYQELNKTKQAKSKSKSLDNNGEIKQNDSPNDAPNNESNDSNDSLKLRALDTALGIDLIMCRILSFLDFQSLIKCSLINSNWLENTFQNASIYNLNLGSLYNYKKLVLNMQPWNYFEKLNKEGQSKCEDEEKKLLLRFRNVLSLTMQRWPGGSLIQYFENLKKFKKLRQLFIVQPIANGIPRLDVTSQEYRRIILGIIKTNAYNLNTLSIAPFYSETFNAAFLNEIWRLKLSNLQTLKIKNIVLTNAFITNSSIIAPKLIELYLNRCEFDMEMFRQCYNLFNKLEILKIDRVRIDTLTNNNNANNNINIVMNQDNETKNKRDLFLSSLLAVKPLMLNFSTLKHLYFRGNGIGSGGVTDRAGLAFGLFVEILTILRNCGNNDINSKTQVSCGNQLEYYHLIYIQLISPMNILSNIR